MLRFDLNLHTYIHINKVSSQQRIGSGYMYWQNRKRHRHHGVTQNEKKFLHAKFKSGDPAHRHRDTK